jgi:hypothetical protein
MFESMHGELKTYQLTEEERADIIKKYGPPMPKHGDIRFTNLIRRREKEQHH